jgi:aryl-alcohol dehydrogenase-like predicted oxidoreductase
MLKVGVTRQPDGKITYVGGSNFAGWDVALAQSAAASRHFLCLVSEQSLYNLAVRAVEQELIPALRHLDVGLIPYSPARRPARRRPGSRHSGTRV